jgi:ankyrin repeat protein
MLALHAMNATVAFSALVKTPWSDAHFAAMQSNTGYFVQLSQKTSEEIESELLSKSEYFDFLPIHCAAKQGDFSMVLLIIEILPEHLKEVTFTALTNKGENICHLAATHKDLRFFEDFNQHDPALCLRLLVDTSHPERWLPIHVAAVLGNFNAVLTIIHLVPTRTEDSSDDSDSMWKAITRDGNLCHIATSSGNSQFFRELHKENKKLSDYLLKEKREDNQAMPIHEAARRGNFEIVRTILELLPRNEKYSTWLSTTSNGDNLCHLAAQAGNPEFFEQFNQYDRPLFLTLLMNGWNAQGLQPIHSATLQGNFTTVLTIMNLAPDSHALCQSRTHYGENICHLAASQDHSLCFLEPLASAMPKLFFDMILQPTLNNETPLAIAQRCQQPEAYNFLSLYLAEAQALIQQHNAQMMQRITQTLYAKDLDQNPAKHSETSALPEKIDLGFILFRCERKARDAQRTLQMASQNYDLLYKQHPPELEPTYEKTRMQILALAIQQSTVAPFFDPQNALEVLKTIRITLDKNKKDIPRWLAQPECCYLLEVILATALYCNKINQLQTIDACCILQAIHLLKTCIEILSLPRSCESNVFLGKDLNFVKKTFQSLLKRPIKSPTDSPCSNQTFSLFFEDFIADNAVFKDR